jgi:hypothetical protein
MKLFVATNPENGWDCVIGVYKAESAEAVEEYIWKEAGWDARPENFHYRCRVHEQTLTEVGE